MATGYILDIVGSLYAPCTSLRMSSGWAVIKKSCFQQVPASQPLVFDPKTGEFDAGGVSIQFSDPVSWLIEQRKTSPRTTNTNDVGEAVTTPWTVGDTSAFETEGWFWIGSEAVQYVGKSATQLGTTSIARGALGTEAQEHSATAIVYGYNPFLHGRKCTLYRSVLQSPAVREEMFVGYIDEINERGRSLRLISNKKRIIDHVVGAGVFAKGRLRHAMDKNTTRLYVDLANKSRVFPVYSGIPSYLRLGDEVIRYRYSLYPPAKYDISSVLNDYQVEANSAFIRDLEPGDTVDFLDSSGDLIAGGEGVRITGITKGTPDTIEHSSGLGVSELSVGDEIHSNYRMELWGLDRGVWDSPVVGRELPAVERGEEVEEVRVLEGNQLVLLLQMLFSKKGDGTNGPNSGLYDVLPEGWGLGLSASEVDTASFQEVASRTSYRRYERTEALPLRDYLSWFALETNSVVFINEAGVLTCRLRGDVYPGGFPDHLLNRSNLIPDPLPAQDVKLSSVANFASIRANFTVSGEARFVEEIRQEDSIQFYGIHPLFELEDTGIVMVGGISSLTYHIEAALAFRAQPQVILGVTVKFDAAVTWTPGQVVRVTLPHLLDLEGGKGLDGEDFEVIESQRNPHSQTVTLLLQQRRPSIDRGRVAPSAIVESVSGPTLTLKATSDTGFSYTNAADVSLETPSGEEGTEDIDWLVEGLNVQIWNETDMNNGTYHSTFIDSIDYAARTITLNSMPAWTVALGDIVRLEQWNTIGASLVAELYQFVFVALANDASPPVLGSSDNPYRVGL